MSINKQPSMLKTLSYSSYMFYFQFMTGIFDVFIYYFYEVKLNLNFGYIALAMTVWTIWDALNEPLIGHLTDRITRITPKWGKRFPWIFLGIIISILAFMMTYMPPLYDAGDNPWPLTLWLMISICLYDTGITLCDLNMNALFPDLYRSDQARRRIQGWSVPISLIALPLSSLLPGLFLFSDDPVGYRTMALIAGGILFLFSMMGLFGVKEDKETIERYYHVKEENRESFVKALTSTFKQKAFVIMLIMMYGYGLVVGAAQGSFPYVVDYILHAGESMAFMFFMAALVMGALISSPFWVMIFKKINYNKKSYLIAGIFLTITTLSLGAIVDIITGMITIALFGISMGAFWVINILMMSDVYDERASILGTDQRGVTVGVLGCLVKLGRFLQIGLFWVVHELTGFDSEADIQSSTALFGIRLHAAIIPAIFYGLLLIIFWFQFPHTRENVVEFKQKLQQLGI